ncbi:hypothetical protein [Trebonia sp.]|uniref:hypothetical protein n=1 Tax=Trebonia sp. TaxID=2767075 RepID=UPI00262CC393|nr:hypothetical protein [Trebonia sp.]
MSDTGGEHQDDDESPLEKLRRQHREEHEARQAAWDAGHAGDPDDPFTQAEMENIVSDIDEPVFGDLAGAAAAGGPVVVLQREGPELARQGVARAGVPGERPGPDPGPAGRGVRRGRRRWSPMRRRSRCGRGRRGASRRPPACSGRRPGRR